MKHLDTMVMFNRRCKSLGRIDTEIACQVNQYEEYWKSLLQRLVSVIKSIADRGLAFRADDENVGSPKSKFSKKRRCDASGDLFCNSFTNWWLS